MLVELMERDLANKKAAATSAAASQAQNAQPSRSDLPWVAKGIVVKVSRRTGRHPPFRSNKSESEDCPTIPQPPN